MPHQSLQAWLIWACARSLQVHSILFTSHTTCVHLQVLDHVTLHAPRIPVISNVTGQPMESPEEIRGLLARQLVEPVQWEATLKHLTGSMEKSELFELGPGQQIKAMCKRINPAIVKAFRNVSP